MAKCDYCGDEVDYLPFTCRYCGKYYCKNHRIPENHKCSFEFKNDPFKIKSIEKAKPSKIYADFPAETIAPEDSDRRERERFPKFRNRTRPQITSLLGMQAKPYGTYGIMITYVVFFALTVIFYRSPQILYLSISDYLDEIYYWTFLTSIFLPFGPIGVSPFYIFLGLLMVFIKVFMLFFIGRMIEARWGWKTLVWTYILSGLLASIGILLVHWVSTLFNFPAPGFNTMQYYSSWGATMGLITFIALLFPQQQVTMFLYFIPIRVKMKNLLLILIGIEAIVGLYSFIFAFFSDQPSFSFPQNFGNIAGVLGGLIMLRVLRKRM